MSLLSESIARIRSLANDLKNDPSGSIQPDNKYTDEQIIREIKRALQDSFDKERIMFYPNSLTALAAITDLDIDSPMPVDDQFLPLIEAKAYATLESANQTGVRPAVGNQLQQLEEEGP